MTVDLRGFNADDVVPTVFVDGAPIVLPPDPPDVERFVLARPWVLVKCVRATTHPGWDYVGEAASATTLEAITAANMLLTGQAEMGLAKPWRKARTFLTYDAEGNLTDPPPNEDDEDSDA